MQLASGDLWAGAEAQLLALATALDKSGVPVTVVLMNHGILERRLREAGLAVVVIDETAHSTPVIIYRLARLMHDSRTEILHTHRIKENIVGSIAALLTGNIPSVRTIHGVPEQQPGAWEFRNRFLHLLNRVAGRLLQKRIFSVSNDLVAILEREYPRERIVVIPNGIDTGVSDTAREYPVTGNTDQPFRVGLAGRLVAVKRVDILIHTARLLLDAHPDIDIEFTVYGDGPLRNQLESLNHETGTDRIVHFAGHRDDINGILAQLDALILTSDGEGLPMILLEAMLARTPVIAHATGGIPELLCHGQCGALVHDHSPQGYAAQICRLAVDPQLRKAIADAAWQQVTTRYSAAANAELYLENYTRLCSPSR